MKSLPATAWGDALLISREEARRIGYELEQAAERIEALEREMEARAASPKVPQDDHIMDALVYGTGFMQDGKRVDPKDVYKQALPQGVEEWIEQHAFETESNGWSSNKCVVPVASLRAYLSGVALVPVDCITIVARDVEYSPHTSRHTPFLRINFAYDDYDSRNRVYAMLAATKEKGE